MSPRTLRHFLEELAQKVSVHRSLAASLGTVIRHGTPGCNSITEEGHRLLRCAKEAGIVREFASSNDIVCVLGAITVAVEKDSAPIPRVAHLVDLPSNGMRVLWKMS